MGYWTLLRRVGRYALSDAPDTERTACAGLILLECMHPSPSFALGELPMGFTRDSDTELSPAVSVYHPDLFHCRSLQPCMFSDEIRRF